MSENKQIEKHIFGDQEADVTGASILLDDVTKSYGSGNPAVDHLTLEIPAGQTVMFVGPSGCGKTTTLKMINRLIEPTEGHIIINGDDVTTMNGDRLRRHIGYVIQAGGLLPHMSVAANIGIVPKMLGWSKSRIADRVDELLDLVSLDPGVYRDRYPRELSGGQQQRVGVARALAADPPVLLMDEPFGAVDPITRQRLQEELIHIQNELHKTIVFVTHDFDEAVKLGDWIVIFNEGAHIMQYDTPERILANPSNEFVEDFIGSGAGLMQLGLARVSDVPLKEAVRARPGEDSLEVDRRLKAAGVRRVVVLDRRDRPVGWVSSKQILRTSRIRSDYNQELPIVGASSTLDDALDTMLVAGSTEAIVHGPRRRFLGLITVNTVIKAIEEISSRAPDEVSAPLGHNTGSDSASSADSSPAEDEASRRRTTSRHSRERRPTPPQRPPVVMGMNERSANPGEQSRIGLIVQPIALLLFLGGMILWLRMTDLTETEQATLASKELRRLTLQHINLTIVAAVIVLATAIPAGIILTRKPFAALTGPITMIANLGQAAPTVGLVVLFAFWLDFGYTAALVSLVVYSFLPVLKNTMVGLKAVDPRLVEAARGMGMSNVAVLTKVELPLAVPVMLAGIRTALVLLVGSATLATFVNGGGLGLLITTGVNLNQVRVLIFGSLLVAVLALGVDWAARVIEYFARPKGL